MTTDQQTTKPRLLTALVAAVVILAAALVFISARLIHLENQRYALMIGSCRSSSDPALVDTRCLRSVETRTSWVWHLFYGLGG
jgi:hypothetical protein